MDYLIVMKMYLIKPYQGFYYYIIIMKFSKKQHGGKRQLILPQHEVL